MMVVVFVDLGNDGGGEGKWAVALLSVTWGWGHVVIREWMYGDVHLYFLLFALSLHSLLGSVSVTWS